MNSQAEKGRLFRELHAREGAFVIPNVFDAGSARIMQHTGFAAVATTSAGAAYTMATVDQRVSRDAMLAHARAIVAGTDLPVSADLENGYGHDPATVAETVRLAAHTGLVGCSIEDGTQIENDPIYDIGKAVERVRAAVEAAHSLPFTFTLTARAENYVTGRPDLRDTIRRLQAYQDAGADVLFAPGLTDRNDIATVVKSIDRPLNVVVGLAGFVAGVADLTALGVKRISVGSSLTRAMYTAVLNAAREMREHGTFAFAKEAVGSAELEKMFNP
ncbi:MAG TPA: isocitrate lyase/phosphoenolpyruvate mutase family protein [Candidatus Krumholzibacteria bacterium]|nr:isocitrate lyase/phosphoenolpyruvate mutase family protein [Candidatus Krumholzibacteria bacterium]